MYALSRETFLSRRLLKKPELPLGWLNSGAIVGVDGALKLGSVGGPVGGWTGKWSSDPESLSMSLSSASLRSLNAERGTRGTSSRKVLTSAKSSPKTSANLKQ